MTLDMLIEALTDLRDAEGVSGDTEVQFQYQPNYPLLAEISGITTKKMMAEHDFDNSEDGVEEGDMSKDDVLKEVEEVVFLTQGSQIGYGDKTAWAAEIR